MSDVFDAYDSAIAGGPRAPNPDAARPDDPGCPVVFLGQHGGDFHFFDHMGQLRVLAAHHIAQPAQISVLFGHQGAAWLAQKFPALSQRGVPTGRFDAADVGHWIIEQSSVAGLFDLRLPVRGIGVWRARDVAVLHLGDLLVWDGEERRPGFREAGALWPAHPAAVKLAPPAPPEDARHLETLFGRWHWRQPMAEAVLFGLYAAGMMGAAIPWRPHGFVVGEAGSGKSTLFDLLAEANPLATLVNDYTEAGLRQTLATHASAALLDEADADEASAMEKLQRVIGLLRRSSGGAGVSALRGGAGGTPQRFDVVASALMGGILPPVFLPQDASRITRLDVLRRAPDGAPLPSPAERARLRANGPALLARAMKVLPRFAAAFEEARRQLLALDGEAPRVADQIGAILAARHIMQHDSDLPDLSEEIGILAWAIPSAETRQAEGGPQQALHHLLHAPMETFRQGERPTVRRQIMAALEVGTEASISDARRSLMDHGMRVGPYPLSDPNGPLCLYVMNQHQQLARVFAGTRWAGGKWAEDLARLPYAIRPDNPVKLMSGTKVRCVVIPPALLPSPSDDTGSDASPDPERPPDRPAPSRLTPEQLAEVEAMLTGGHTVAAVAAHLRVSLDAVDEVMRRLRRAQRGRK